MQQIKITNLHSHMQIEWADGTIHTWHPENLVSWHHFINKIADNVPVYYSAEPVVRSGAGGLQCEQGEGLIAFCDLWDCTISYTKGLWSVTKHGNIIVYGAELESVLEKATKAMTS